MTIKHKLLLTAAAVTLAVAGITGAVAAGRAKDAGTACPKADCAGECPKKGACPPCSGCPGH